MRIRTSPALLATAILTTAALLATGGSTAQGDGSGDLAGTWTVTGSTGVEHYRGLLTLRPLASNGDGRGQRFEVSGDLGATHRGRFQSVGVLRGDTLSFDYTLVPRAGITDVLERIGEDASPEEPQPTTISVNARFDRDAERWTGSWRSSDGRSGSERWERNRPQPRITALEPARFDIPLLAEAAGAASGGLPRPGGSREIFRDVVIRGENLPSAPQPEDFSFGGAAGIRVVEVHGSNSAGTRVEVDLEISSRAEPGTFDLGIGEVVGERLIELLAPTPVVPLGGSARQAGDGSFVKVYVPTRYESHLAVSSSAGKVTICFPDKQTELGDGADLVTRQAGWYYARIDGDAGPYIVEASLEQRARASWVPYNFWYFPYYEGSDSPHGWTVAKAYDGWRGDGSTKAHDWEDGHHHTTDASTAWWGHCGAAAKASILFKQPPLRDRKKKKLSEDQIEGLLSLYCRTHGKTRVSYFNRHTSTASSATKPGQGADANDQYADDFFKALRDLILVQKQVALIDMEAKGGTTAGEKWNQGCYKYTAKFEQTAGGGGQRDVTVTLTFVSSEDNNRPRNGNPETGASWTQVSKLRLVYADSGEIDGGASEQDYIGNWFGSVGGSQLFAPGYVIRVLSAGANGGSNGNPHITWADLEAMGVEKNPAFQSTR